MSKPRVCGQAFVLALALIPLNLSFQEPEPSRLDRAFMLLRAGNLEAAEGAFLAVAKADPRNARTYYGLGLIYAQHKNKELTTLRYFQQAVKNAPQFQDALFELGKAGLALGNYDGLSEARKAFSRLLELNPDHGESVALLGLTFRRQLKPRDGLKFFKGLYNAHPTPAVLAQFLSFAKELGREEDLSKLRKDWQGVHKENLSPPARLELGKALLQVGEAEPGTELYLGALEELDEEAYNRLFREIRPLASEAERDEFGQTPKEKKGGFFRGFWVRRDPTPTTPVNERLAEHYRRLTYAVSHFGVPTGQGYDERGEIYIRHGEPDEKVTYYGDFAVRDNESWLYSKNRARKLLFHFGDQGGGYFGLVRRLEELSRDVESRQMYRARRGRGAASRRMLAESIGPTTNPLDRLFASRADLDPLYYVASLPGRIGSYADILRQEEILIETSLLLGTTTTTFRYDYPGKAMDFFFYPVTFKGVLGRTELDFFVGVPAEELKFQPGEMGHEGNLRRELVLYDVAWHEAGRETHSRRLHSRLPLEAGKGQLIPDQVSLALPPGAYHFAVSLQDSLSQKLGIYTGDLTVPTYGDSALQLSDLVLAVDVGPAREGEKLVRHGLKIVPLPSRAFGQTTPVSIYYEVYNLACGSEEMARWRTRVTVFGQALERDLPSRILSVLGRLVGTKPGAGQTTLTFEREAECKRSIAVQPEYLAFDLRQSPAGKYRLLVEVEDLTTPAESHTEQIFFLLEN